MQQGKYAQVIIYLDLFDSGTSAVIGPRAIKQYLHYLKLSSCLTLEDGWDTLKAVLEEWQRHFLLMVDIKKTTKMNATESSLLQHVVNNLPRSRVRIALFLGDMDLRDPLRTMKHASSGLDETLIPRWEHYLNRFGHLIGPLWASFAFRTLRTPLVTIPSAIIRLQRHLGRKPSWEKTELLFVEPLTASAHQAKNNPVTKPR